MKPDLSSTSFLTAAAFLAVLLMMCISPAAAIRTESPDIVESVEVTVSPGEARTVPGESAVFRYTLTNENPYFVYVKVIPDRLGAALEGWSVSVKITNSNDVFTSMAPFENGSIVKIDAESDKSVYLLVRPPGDARNGSSLTTETLFLTLRIQEDVRVEGEYSSAGPVLTTVETGERENENLPVVLTAATGIALVGLIYGAGTETGRYSLAGLFAPLYSRIRGDRVFDNDLRDSLYNYILENPGINFSSLMKEMGVKNGTLSHHLRTLERERFIRSRREGAYRRFYPRGVKITAVPRDLLNPFQRSILDYVRTNAGNNQSLIANELNCSRQVVSYNIGILSGAGMIHVEKHGRKCFCYPVKAGANA